MVTNRFEAEIALGRLTFKALNYDQPENAHFLKDYKLPCPSLVLVRQRGGKDQDWKLLGQTWEMVQIPPKLDLYIEEELRRFLAATNSAASTGGGTNAAGMPAGLGTNIAALALFIAKGHIWWHFALAMAVANVVGSLAGTHMALKHGTGFVRWVFIAVVSALILKTGFDAFLR